MRCYRIVAYSGTIAKALGEPSHIVQVEIIGAFKTKAAFARAVTAAGLYNNERQALREMYRAGGETGNETALATTNAAPEKLFAGSLNHRSDRNYIPLPLGSAP